MFDFIGKILNGIGQLICDFILLVIIVLLVVIIYLIGSRKANNPYAERSPKAMVEQVESEYNAALHRLYNEYKR